MPFAIFFELNLTWSRVKFEDLNNLVQKSCIFALFYTYFYFMYTHVCYFYKKYSPQHTAKASVGCMLQSYPAGHLSPPLPQCQLANGDPYSHGLTEKRHIRM